MKYTNITKASFLSRPNRFIAKVKIGNKVETVHVKNTGRCKELLIPGCEVWLTAPGTQGRKTKYDLVAVRKDNGILHMITAAFGLAGLAISLIGIRDNASGNGFVSGVVIIGAGIATYVIIMFLTSVLLHRQVTTELILIIGWAMLEIASVNTAYSLEHIAWNKVVLFLIIVSVAAVSSLVFYLLYYRVEPVLGYYFGMVPLVTEALCMGIFMVLNKCNQR